MNQYVVWYYNEFTTKKVKQRITAKSEKKAKEMFFKTHKDDELTMDDLHVEPLCEVFHSNKGLEND